VLPAIGMVLLIIFALLYKFDYDTYLSVLSYPVDGVFQYPFLDWIYVPAQIECWRQGIDVYAGAPCDPLHRPMDYSPLWLRLTFIPTSKDAVVWTALGLDVLFIASLGFLPRPRRGLEFVTMALATYSSATLLALERANTDLLSFVLAVAAGICLGRKPAYRPAAYCAIVLAGVLKFYPLVLLTVLLRERPAVCITLGLIISAFLGVLGFVYMSELARMFPNVPRWNYFEPDIWGAVRLPGGAGEILRTCARMLGLRGEWVDGLGSAKSVYWIVWLVLLLTMLTSALLLARSLSIRSAFGALSDSQVNFLVMGAAITCGCFIAGQSIRYRAIVMLLALPGLLALARDGLSLVSRTAFTLAVVCLLLELWEPLLTRIAGDVFGFASVPATWGPNFGYSFWLIEELACWSLATILMSVLFWFIQRSPIFRILRARWW
jgi:hypothetical protein